MFRWGARCLRAGFELSAVFDMPVVVHAEAVRVPLARAGEPDLPLGVRLVSVAAVPAGGGRGAGEGEMRGSAGRAGGAGVADGATGCCQAAASSKT